MSPREQLNCKEIKVATMVWEGHTNPEIAAVLGTSEQVIKNHLRNVFDKLGVWSRLELALYIASHGGTRWADGLAGAGPGRRGSRGRFPRRLARHGVHQGVDVAHQEFAILRRDPHKAHPYAEAGR
jgi:DNA-binding CsgD family transcriptional regulator